MKRGRTYTGCCQIGLGQPEARKLEILNFEGSTDLHSLLSNQIRPTSSTHDGDHSASSTQSNQRELGDRRELHERGLSGRCWDAGAGRAAPCGKGEAAVGAAAWGGWRRAMQRWGRAAPRGEDAGEHLTCGVACRCCCLGRHLERLERSDAAVFRLLTGFHMLVHSCT